MQLSALPTTYSGEQSEAFASDVFSNRPVRNLSAIANPEVLEGLARQFAARMNDPACIDELPRPALSDPAELTAFFIRFWERHLAYGPIDADSNFFNLGGNLLTVAVLFAGCAAAQDHGLPPNSLMEAPTIRQLVQLLGQTPSPVDTRLVWLRTGTGGDPLFIIHSVVGTVLQLWRLQRYLQTPFTIYGIEAEETEQLTNKIVTSLAAVYIGLMKSVQLRGPYSICGYSFGGLIAFEMARQLAAHGNALDRLILIDTSPYPRYLPLPLWSAYIMRRLRMTALGVIQTRFHPMRDQRSLFSAPANIDRPIPPGLPVASDARDQNQQRILRRLQRARRGYRPNSFAGRIAYISGPRPRSGAMPPQSGHGSRSRAARCIPRLAIISR